MLRTVLQCSAGLVIGDAQRVALQMPLHQIDGTAQSNIIQYHGLFFCALRIAMFIQREAKSKLEVHWKPFRWPSGYLLNPAAQVRSHAFYFTFPDARDSGREIVFEFSCHTVQHLIGNVESFRQAIRHHRQETGCFQFSKQLELNLVEERAASKRVHLFEWNRGFASAKLE